MAHVSNTPKAVREALCAAQAALVSWEEDSQRDIDRDRIPGWINQLGELIAEIDLTHRPLGVNGKHGSLHTDTCGCPGHRVPWSIVLEPVMDGYDSS